MMNIIHASEVAGLLGALEEQLAAAEAGSVHLVVCGGAALNVLGYIDRPTRDVDVVARGGDALEGFVPPAPFPARLKAAAERVALDYGLPNDWLNPGPGDLWRLGLPEGWRSRLVTEVIGGALTVSFLGRFDLVCLKLFALADQGPGKHEQDLRALAPSRSELETAARWCRSHDPSPAFEQLLVGALELMGAGSGPDDAP